MNASSDLSSLWDSCRTAMQITTCWQTILDSDNYLQSSALPKLAGDMYVSYAYNLIRRTAMWFYYSVNFHSITMAVWETEQEKRRTSRRRKKKNTKEKTDKHLQRNASFFQLLCQAGNTDCLDPKTTLQHLMAWMPVGPPRQVSKTRLWYRILACTVRSSFANTYRGTTIYKIYSH